VSKNPRQGTADTSSVIFPFAEQPALQLIYDTAPIGLAFLSPDCRYLQVLMSIRGKSRVSCSI
jgi:hypothetical protein